MGWPNLKKIKSNIEKTITDYLSEELNKNSEGIYFDTGFWYSTTDRDSQNKKVITTDDGFQYEQEQIVPFVIESYDGDIVGLEGIFSVEYDVPITFQIAVSDPDFFGKAVEAIDEVKNNNRGQMRRWSISLEDTEGNDITEYFTALINTDNLTPAGDIELQKGRRYVFGQINYSFTITHDISVGNQVHIEMKEKGDEEYVRIYPLEPNTSRQNTMEEIFTFGSQDAKHKVQETSYGKSYALIVEEKDLHWSILEDIVKKNKLNKDFTIKETFHRFNGDKLEKEFSYERDVKIKEGQAFYGIGEEMAVVFTVVESIDDEHKESDA